MSQWVKVAIVWGGEDPDYTCLLARNESMSYFFIHSWDFAPQKNIVIQEAETLL